MYVVVACSAKQRLQSLKTFPKRHTFIKAGVVNRVREPHSRHSWRNEVGMARNDTRTHSVLPRGVGDVHPNKELFSPITHLQ
jgi:hypothetical protein